jgi:hypothetical protein
MKITEQWLGEVGFKYREPGERQPFRHWTLTFSEPDDYGLYIETTMPGWLNAKGEHVNADSGWFLWLGRESQSIHLRHVNEQEEIIAVVEALIGQKWEPTRAGHVRVRKHIASSVSPTPSGITAPKTEAVTE